MYYKVEKIEIKLELLSWKKIILKLQLKIFVEITKTLVGTLNSGLGLGLGLVTRGLGLRLGLGL